MGEDGVYTATVVREREGRGGGGGVAMTEPGEGSLVLSLRD